MSADVSIVVPTRDRLALLEQTLETVHGQGTVVVVDDGSSGRHRRTPGRAPVTVVRNDGPAWGPARARNAGIAATRTELVAFVDSDDLLLPGRSEARRGTRGPPRGTVRLRMRAERRQHRARMGPGGADRAAAGAHGRAVHPEPGPFERASSGGATRCERVGGFDERLTYSEDHDLWLRLARLGAPAHVPGAGGRPPPPRRQPPRPGARARRRGGDHGTPRPRQRSAPERSGTLLSSTPSRPCARGGRTS